MENLLSLAIFGSFVWACIFVLALIITLFVSEHVEHGGIAFVGVVAFWAVNYFWGNIPLTNYINWLNIAAYLAIGLLYTVIKAYFRGRSTKYFNDELRYLKGNVFRWWFIWPISLLSWIFSDLLEQAWDWVYQKFQSTFEFFLRLGFKSNKHNTTENL